MEDARLDYAGTETGLELEMPKRAKANRCSPCHWEPESPGGAYWACSLFPAMLALGTASSTWPSTLPPLRHSQGGTHLSHSGVSITNLAQICLSTQKCGQLGLGQQVLQVVGSSNVQLGQGQADSPVEITPLEAWGALNHREKRLSAQSASVV